MNLFWLFEAGATDWILLSEAMPHSDALNT
jgi:hypothetical protein